MKVEGIRCTGIKPDGEKLVLILIETSFEEIENTLVGKDELSVYTDNLEEDKLTEKHMNMRKQTVASMTMISKPTH